MGRVNSARRLPNWIPFAHLPPCVVIRPHLRNHRRARLERRANEIFKAKAYAPARLDRQPSGRVDITEILRDGVIRAQSGKCFPINARTGAEL
jgi:hypothetical protein